MTKKTRSKATKKRASPASADRRQNLELREVLDELVEYVRRLASTVDTMGPSELEYAQERLEWLADEVWRLMTESKKG